MGHSKSARGMLQKYYKGVLPEEERKGGRKGRAAAGGAGGGGGGGGGLGLLAYAVPVVAIAAAVWFQFLRPKADAAA